MNQSTFKELYLSQWPQLYGLASRILANEADAADAVQDVFQRLLEESDSRRAVRAAMPLDQAPPLAQTGAEAEQQSSAEYIRACIDILPPGQATVMKLRVYNGLDNKEIASHTGFSDETVRQQLSRARRKLKELLNRPK